MLKLIWEKVPTMYRGFEHHHAYLVWNDTTYQRSNKIPLGFIMRRVEVYVEAHRRWKWCPNETLRAHASTWDQKEPFAGTLQGVKCEIEARIFVCLLGDRDVQPWLVKRAVEKADEVKRTGFGEAARDWSGEEPKR